MSATPLARSSRSAMRQNGHTPVAYIITLATSPLHGQARLLPGREAALEVDDLGEPGVLQNPAGIPRARAAGAGDQDRLLLPLRELVDALGELAHGDVPRARQVA